MADIELVIKIPETLYVKGFENIFSEEEKEELIIAMGNGTLLPKEHGKLSDMDELVKKIVNEYGVNSIHELPQDIKAFFEKFIAFAPTVLEATFDYKLKNYACVKGVEE